MATESSIGKGEESSTSAAKELSDGKESSTAMEAGKGNLTVDSSFTALASSVASFSDTIWYSICHTLPQTF